MDNINEKKAIARGVQMNYLHLALTSGLTFILTPFILHHLGQTAYGIWALLGSAIGYLGLFNFGMGTATTKYTAEYRTQGDTKRMSQLVSSVMVLYLLLGLAILMVCGVLTPFLDQLFKIPPPMVAAAQWAFMLMGLNLAFRLVGEVLGAVIYGHQRVDAYRRVHIVQALVNALLVLLLLTGGMGINGVVLAMLGASLAGIGLYWRFIKRSNYGVQIQLQLANKATVKSVAPYSLRTFVLSLTSQLLYRTDNIVIGAFLGTALVTPYAIAYKLCFTLTYLFSAIPNTFFPRFTTLYTLKDYPGLSLLLIKTTKLSVAIMTALALVLIFYGETAITLWVGANNFVGMPVLAVFIAMFFVHSLGGCGVLLQSIGHNRIFMYSELCNAFLNLVLSIILLHYWGLLGVALGTLLAHLLTSSWVIPYLACRYSRTPLSAFLYGGIIKPLACGSVVALLIWLVKDSIPPVGNLAYLVLVSIVIVLLYALVLVFIGFNGKERKEYWSLILQTSRLK